MTGMRIPGRVVAGALLGLVLEALLTLALSAQQVTGVLVEGESGPPVEGAMISLLPPGGEAAVSTLTDAGGRFRLDAPSPGAYRLRADRIGYTSTVSDPFRVGGGETVERRLVARVQAVDLEGIDVEGEKRCVVRPQEGLATARVWDEARKALAAAAWTRERGIYRYRLVNYERELEPDARRVLEEERRYERGFSRNPFVSRPAEELLEDGFVERGPEGGFVYYAPDADVLLSDPFLDTHCVRLRRGQDEAEGLLGLAFEPVDDRDVPDIEGVLWLDPATQRLRWLDFRYTDVWLDISTEHLGGRIVFEALPNGTWIVREWRIRMPIVARRQDRFARPGHDLYLARVKETGGEVIRVEEPGGRVVLDTESGALRGVVLDSLGSGPVAEASVGIRGTDLHAVTGPSGKFRFQGLGEGTYELTYTHPVLDSLGHRAESHPVEVRKGEVASLRVRIPSRSEVLEGLCRDPDRPPDAGILVGWVRSREGGKALPGARVEVRWSGWWASRRGPEAPVEVEETRYRLSLDTDEGGFFRACTVPTDHPIQITAEVDGVRSGPEEVRVPPDPGILARVVPLPR